MLSCARHVFGAVLVVHFGTLILKIAACLI